MTRAVVAIPLVLSLIALCVASPAPRSRRAPKPKPDVAPMAIAGKLDRDIAQIKADPIVFIGECLTRCQSDVRGYRATLEKRERIGKTLKPRERLRIAFQERPFSVMMRWDEGGGLASGSLFVDGENDNQMLVMPAGLFLSRLGPLKKSLSSPDVVSVSRYGIREFGIERGMARTYTAWGNAQKAGTLVVHYEGVHAIPEAGGKLCHVLRREVNPPEEQGLTQVTICLDVVTGLQVSSRLLVGKELIGEYHFRDIELNPIYAPNQFTTETLKRDR